MSDYCRNIPKPIPEGWLENQIKEGRLIPMNKLEDGAFYRGSCSNTDYAVWNAQKKVFTYLREKFGVTFSEEINPVELDNGYDLFIPWYKV